MASSVALSFLDELLAPYELLHKIGSRPGSLYLVRHAAPGTKPKLFVAEQFEGMGDPNDARANAFIVEARRISTLASSNLVRVRELAVRGNDLVVFSDFIDGGKLFETWLDGGMPLEVALRMILDVLSGLGAIHGLRDAAQQPMQIAHGELSTATIVIGIDGTARVLHAIARRAPNAQSEHASHGYLAPEVHAREAYGARADVFSAGVLLWEALAGKRLFSEGNAAAILARTRSGGVPPADVPGHSSWAKGLVQVAAKALAASPDDRWPSAATMGAEIRKVVGLRLASATTAAAFAKAAMGERVNERRKRFEAMVVVPGSALLATAEGPRAAGPGQGARVWSGDDGGSGAPAVVPTRIAVLEAAPVKSSPPSPSPQAERVVCDSDIHLAPESLPPPALATSIANPIVSPTDEAVSAPSPPPLPMRALPPPDPISSGPNLAPDQGNATHDVPEAIDVSMSIPPPADDLSEMSPTSVERGGGGAPDRDGRRLRVAILGGVGVLGVIVFALAGWRATHRDADVPLRNGGPAATAAPVSSSAPEAAVVPAVVSIPPSTPAPSPLAVAMPSTPVTTVTAGAPSGVLPAPRAVHAAVVANPVSIPRALSAGAPGHKSSSLPGARPKARPNSSYDPNSL